ncbi:MAG: response regulator [Gemmatimonadaceae bacterium]
MNERLRVLVADDEPHIGRIIKMKLEQGPFDVVLVYDGQEAVDAMEQGDDFALVVLDLMMPRLSGLEVLQHIRANDRWKSLPCIVLTAAGEQQYQRRALEIGASEFLTKPFSPRKLYARAMQLTGAESENAGVREA